MSDRISLYDLLRALASAEKRYMDLQAVLPIDRTVKQWEALKDEYNAISKLKVAVAQRQNRNTVEKRRRNLRRSELSELLRSKGDKS
jgi:hypothetical protein